MLSGTQDGVSCSAVWADGRRVALVPEGTVDSRGWQARKGLEDPCPNTPYSLGGVPIARGGL